MSSGIAWVFMLALLCAAIGVMSWDRGSHRRAAQAAKHFFERQMKSSRNRASAESMNTRIARAHRQADNSRLLRALADLMRRANVRNPRLALLIWASATGVIAFICATRVAPAMAIVVATLSAVFFYAMLACHAQQRKERIVRQLPSFLEGIVRFMGIGNSVSAAFQAAAANAPAPLSECLAEVMPRLRAGTDIDQALATLARVYRVREFELIGAVLRISIRFGGRSDVMLERMASFMRDLDEADRDKAAPCTGTRPSSWSLGLLPAVLGGSVVLLNPACLEAMGADEIGRPFIYGALALQALGAHLLSRLARLRD